VNRRVIINLTVFALLAVVMSVWALTNVVTFDFLKRPYHVTAEFASSPGLHPGFEVDYLGVPVGKIGSVKLEQGRVKVRLDLDRGRTLPAHLTAAAARKSAVGEPYVALSPQPGASGGPSLRPGATIPVRDTSVPPAYGDLFGAVNRSLAGVNPDDVAALVHELYLGWNGRADSLRKIIQGGDQITQTFADNSDLINGLTDDLTKITHVLAQNRGALGEGIDNLAAVTGSLRQVKEQLTQLRDRGPGLLDQVNSLLDTSRPDLRCAVGSLSATLPGLATTRNLTALAATLDDAKPLVKVLHDVLRKVGGEYALNVLFILTFKTPAALEFKYPLSQPAIKAGPTCANGRVPGTAEQAPYTGKDPGSVTPPQYRTAQKTTEVVNLSSGGSAGPPAWLVYVPPVLALLVLIKVMAGSVPVLSRRRRRKS
jgi:virulence factor Mce-like protein